MNLITNYGNVQIYETAKDHFFYSVVADALQSRKQVDLITLLLQDDFIEEIMFIGQDKPLKINHSVYGMCNSNINIDESDAQAIIMDTASRNNKIINEKNPIMDATLPDGSVINATIYPASVDGSTFTIRKYRQNILTIVDLLRNKTLTPQVGAYLWTVVEGLNVRPANVIFSGGTGSGKTTNLNAFSMFIPFSSRIITIEDTPELHLLHEHLIRLSSVEGVADMSKLLMNTLRMRPDRIIVGEVIGQEAKTLFTAMNTGHEGCMGTMHSNTTKETLMRITQDPMNVPPIMLSGLDLIVMQQRIISGRMHARFITEISEIASISTGTDLPKFNTIYKWNPSKRLCQRTGVPSGLKEKISKAANITPKDFDAILKQREALLAMAFQNSYNRNQLMNLIIKNIFSNSTN